MSNRRLIKIVNLIIFLFILNSQAFSQNPDSIVKVENYPVEIQNEKSNMGSNAPSTNESQTNQNSIKGFKPLEEYHELLFINNKTYDLMIFRTEDKLYKISVTRDISWNYKITTANAENSGQDTTKIMSNIPFDKNITYISFEKVVVDIFITSLIPLIEDSNLKKNVVDDLKSQLPIVYSNIFSKIKYNNSDEIKQLKDQLDKYSGELEDKYKYAGIVKIKSTRIPTYQHFTANALERRRAEMNKENENIDSVLELLKVDKQFLNEQLKKLKNLQSVNISKFYVQKYGVVNKQNIQPIEIEEMITKISRQEDSLKQRLEENKFRKIKNKYTRTAGVFEVDSVYLSVFNSAVDKLAFYGRYTRDTNIQNNAIRPITFNYPLNFYSRFFGFRAMLSKPYYFIVNRGEINEYVIKISDLLDFTHYKTNHSYIVKDQSILLDKDDNRSQNVERRTLYDYLTLITFIDFLGLSNSVNNNYIQIEGRTRFPLNLSTWAKMGVSNVTLFPIFEAYLNSSFINGSNLGGRKTTVNSNASGDTLFYDHFDLVRNYNVKTGLSLGLMSLNYRAIHSRIFFNWDLKMYRTSFSFDKINQGPDSVINSNIYSMSHGPSILFEYRPDFNIGADLRISADYNLSPLNFENNGYQFLPSKGPVFSNNSSQYQKIYKSKKNIYGLELNIYSFLSPRKERNDGIYFRMAFFTNYNISQISPYILAGYATSLKGLVKAKKE